MTAKTACWDPMSPAAVAERGRRMDLEPSITRPRCRMCRWGAYYRSSRGPVCQRCDEKLARTDSVITFGQRGMLVESRAVVIARGGRR